MATLVDKLEALGVGESAGFLNDIVAGLWPNINVAGCKMTKEIVEPMFKTMLPGPLSSLHFTKIDLGTVPLKFSNVAVQKIERQGIKLDLDVDWAGQCDIELDGKMIPQVGVKHVSLQGRLSILLCPLMEVLPLIGAAQITFVNPPKLELDFTGGANVADLSILKSEVRKVILGIISSMAVLPNRFLVKMDTNNDYFRTYQYQIGILRLTIEKATGFAAPKKGKLIGKLLREAPDTYCHVNVSAEEAWRTSTKNNTTSPAWNETHDFLVSDYDQTIIVDVADQDVGGDDHLGIGTTSVKELFVAGGKQELTLVKKGEEGSIKLSLSGQFYILVPDAGSLSGGLTKDKNTMCGLVTILIARAFGVQGERKELHPSVKVSWGDKSFQTGMQSDAAGVDITNPSFDSAFRIPITSGMADSPAPFKISLLNKNDEVGHADVAFADVLAAPGLILQRKFDVGNGATIDASICVQGMKLEK